MIPDGLRRAMGPLRIIVGVVLFGLVVAAAVDRWDDVRTTIARMSAVDLVLAEVLVLGGLVASVLTWRASLQELGSAVRLDAASKIYLLGQLAKYLPGGVWALAMQMELGSRASIPRLRAVAASIVAMGVNFAVGLALGLLAVPALVEGGLWRTVTLVALFAAVLIGLSPPVLTRLLDLGLRIVRRPELRSDVGWRGILRATAWSIVSWTSYGTSLWVLAVGVGAPPGESLLYCFGGVGLATTVGFLVFVAPSGIGVREAVLVVALAPVLESSEALAVVLAARLVFTLADLIAAAAVTPIRIRATTPAMPSGA